MATYSNICPHCDWEELEIIVQNWISTVEHGKIWTGKKSLGQFSQVYRCQNCGFCWPVK